MHPMMKLMLWRQLVVYIPVISLDYGSSMSCKCRSLRAVKLNKIGLLNYKARHIFYSPEKMKFGWRCHYYRASVFQG